MKFALKAQYKIMNAYFALVAATFSIKWYNHIFFSFYFRNLKITDNFNSIQTKV